MRQIILNLAVTLDGYIEGPNGEYDWCFIDQDYGLTELRNRIDAVFYGRKSYDLMMRAEGKLEPGKTHYVFSRTLTSVAPDAQLVQGDIVQAITRIKQQPGKDIWLFGGADLTAHLLNARLVDELQLSVHPLLLGGGKRLFNALSERIPWQLTDTKTYETGLVQLHYRHTDM